MGMIVKGWYVEALDDNAKDDDKPHKVSRVFHVKAAADQFAALLRCLSKHPDSVNVRQKLGFDKNTAEFR